MARQTLTMPRLGETMETGRLIAWLKAPGEPFARGETIAEVETDKTVVELPALTPGTLLTHLAAPGDDIAVGAPIAEVDAAASAPPQTPPPPEPAAPAAPQPQASAHTPSPGGSARQRATPAARRRARDAGIDLAGVVGTGRRGRIETEDLTAPQAHAPQAPAPRLGLQFAHDGGVVAYDLFGEPTADEVVLLIHGYSGDRLSWGAFAPMLAAGRAVIAPDLPAHGDTTLEADTAETMHTALIPLMAHLKVHSSKLHIVGLSMGGIVATRMAEALVAAGEPPRALSLISPAGMGRGGNYPFIAALAEGPSVGELTQLLRLIAVRPPELSAEILEASVARLAKRRIARVAQNLAGPYGMKQDIIAGLSRLVSHIPVRIAIGMRDEIIAPMDVTNAPPQVAVHLFADAGHMIHWDAPEALAAVLTATR